MLIRNKVALKSNVIATIKIGVAMTCSNFTVDYMTLYYDYAVLFAEKFQQCKLKPLNFFSFPTYLRPWDIDVYASTSLSEFLVTLVWISVKFMSFISFKQVAGNNRFHLWNVPDLRKFSWFNPYFTIVLKIGHHVWMAFI